MAVVDGAPFGAPPVVSDSFSESLFPSCLWTVLVGNLTAIAVVLITMLILWKAGKVQKRGAPDQLAAAPQDEKVDEGSSDSLKGENNDVSQLKNNEIHEDDMQKCKNNDVFDLDDDAWLCPSSHFDPYELDEDVWRSPAGEEILPQEDSSSDSEDMDSSPHSSSSKEQRPPLRRWQMVDGVWKSLEACET